MIVQDGVARLTEYGVALVLSNLEAGLTPNQIVERNDRWQAPEITATETISRKKPELGSKPADVFAFAMLAVEVFTGQVPFGETMNNTTAILEIKKGTRPPKPAEIEDENVWKLVQACWNKRPKKRPDVGNVVANLESLLNGGGLGKSIPIPGDHILIR